MSSLDRMLAGLLSAKRISGFSVINDNPISSKSCHIHTIDWCVNAIAMYSLCCELRPVERALYYA